MVELAVERAETVETTSVQAVAGLPNRGVYPVFIRDFPDWSGRQLRSSLVFLDFIVLLCVKTLCYPV